MQRLVHYSLEPNFHNPDGSALTLYFAESPTEQEVKDACRETLGKQVIGVNPDDDEFSWEVCQTVVADRAGLVRVQAHPTC